MSELSAPTSDVSTIGGAAVPDHEDVDTAIGIGNFIYDSIVPNANSPERFLTPQFAASGWTGVGHQVLNA